MAFSCGRRVAVLIDQLPHIYLPTVECDGGYILMRKLLLFQPRAKCDSCTLICPSRLLRWASFAFCSIRDVSRKERSFSSAAAFLASACSIWSCQEIGHVQFSLKRVTGLQVMLGKLNNNSSPNIRALIERISSTRFIILDKTFLNPWCLAVA